MDDVGPGFSGSSSRFTAYKASGPHRKATSGRFRMCQRPSRAPATSPVPGPRTPARRTSRARLRVRRTDRAGPACRPVPRRPDLQRPCPGHGYSQPRCATRDPTCRVPWSSRRRCRVRARAPYAEIPPTQRTDEIQESRRAGKVIGFRPRGIVSKRSHEVTGVGRAGGCPRQPGARRRAEKVGRGPGLDLQRTWSAPSIAFLN